jgi:hypothetical protein
MSQTILFKDGLRIGKKELQLLQTLGLENLSGVVQALAQELPAVITAVSGELDTGLQVTVIGTDLSIAAGNALLKNGTFLEVSSPLTLVVPSATNQPVVLSAGPTPFAPGTVAIGAADRFTLTYTPAGSVANAAELYASGDALRLVNGGTSLGTFRIQSVTNNTIVLADAVPGSTSLTGLNHAPAGKFFPGYPLEPETTDLISYATPSVRLETSNYTAADNEIILARVTRVASTVTPTDARVAFRARGINNVVNSMVAANASIAESKLALSPELIRAKTFAPLLGVTADNRIFTTQPDFYVTREGQLRRVLLASEVLVPAFSALSVSPGTVSIAAGSTQALTASVTNAPNATPTVTYTFTSLTPSVATVSQTVAGSVNATITGVTSGNALILVTASAPATGGTVAAQETTLVPVAITAGNGSITSLSVSPNPVTMGRNAAPVALTATAAAAAGASPSVTYTWAYVGTASSVVQLSSTTGPSVTLTPQGPGSAQITVVASSTASNGFAAVTLPALTLNVTVTEGLALAAEPAYRVTFRSISDTTHAVFRWGVGGACAVSGLNITMTVDTADRWPTLGLNGLVGQAFYDSAGRRYLIASNAAFAPNDSTLTFTVSKVSASDPNPAVGAGVVRSLANSYRLAIFNQAGTSQLSTTFTPESTSAREFVTTLSSAVQGTSYLFRLTAVNESLSPSSRVTDVTAVWGSSATGIVDVPTTGWIASTPTTAGVNFSWSMLKGLPSNAYNPDTMDYYVRWKVGENSWSVWHRVEDNTVGLTTMQYFVYSPPSTLVQFQVKITDLSGQLSVNGVAEADGTASATTLTVQTGGTDVEYVYPFDFNASPPSSWTQINGRWFYELSRYAVGPAGGAIEMRTSFTSGVSVSRIDLEFDPLNPLAQGVGTAEVKPVVFPTDNNSYQIAGDIVVEGGTNYVQTTDIATTVNVNSNGFITVAIEYAGTLTGTDTPMSLGVDGAGVVTVWFRGSPGDAV